MVETVILDACCMLNLAATGRAEDILRQLPSRFMVGSRAGREAQWQAIPDSDEREVVDLAPLMKAELLLVQMLDSPREDALFVEFSARIDDGEAEAAAVAVSRGYVLATDDRKARRVVTESYPGTRLLSTPELLQRWQQAARPPDDDVADALRRISQRATFRPARGDALYAWWVSRTGH